MNAYCIITEYCSFQSINNTCIIIISEYYYFHYIGWHCSHFEMLQYAARLATLHYATHWIFHIFNSQVFRLDATQWLAGIYHVCIATLLSRSTECRHRIRIGTGSLQWHQYRVSATTAVVTGRNTASGFPLSSTVVPVVMSHEYRYRSRISATMQSVIMTEYHHREWSSISGGISVEYCHHVVTSSFSRRLLHQIYHSTRSHWQYIITNIIHSHLLYSECHLSKISFRIIVSFQ